VIVHVLYDGRILRTGDRTLAIARDYFSLTSVPASKQKIVYRETPFSGTAKPGDVLLVRLVVAGAKDWRYLLIEDMLPAGVETIADNDLYPLEHRHPRPWEGRREFRDDRAVFFQDGLPDGRVEGDVGACEGSRVGGDGPDAFRGTACLQDDHGLAGSRGTERVEEQETVGQSLEIGDDDLGFGPLFF
jgi:hypothetical protein